MVKSMMFRDFIGSFEGFLLQGDLICDLSGGNAIRVNINVLN
jgi:hypothetical protein